MSAVVIAAAVLTVAAPTASEQAHELFKAGSQAYKHGQYPVALRAFEAAFKLSPRAALAFSLAQANRLQYFVDGDTRKLEDAVKYFRVYLDSAPKGGRRDHAAQHLATLQPILERTREAGAPVTPDADAPPAHGQIIVASTTADAYVRLGEDRQPVPAAFDVEPGTYALVIEAAQFTSKTIEAVAVGGGVAAYNVDLEPLPGQLTVNAPDGATIAIDGRAVGSASVTVRPGGHVVTVTSRGREPFVQTVEVGRGESTELAAKLEVTSQRVVSYVLIAGAGMALSGAAVMTGLALDKESSASVIEERIEEGRSLTVAEANRYGTLESQRNGLSRAATGLAIGGGAIGVTALLLWLLDTPEAPAALIAPVATPDGAGVSFAATF